MTSSARRTGDGDPSGEGAVARPGCPPHLSPLPPPQLRAENHGKTGGWERRAKKEVKGQEADGGRGEEAKVSWYAGEKKEKRETRKEGGREAQR